MLEPLELADLPVVFISFDEPEADANFAALKVVVPRAVRVHGVIGFDKAHRAAAAAVEGDYVITVDGDNRVIEPDFFGESYLVGALERASVLSFCARLSHNGLVYGNGGLKIWPKTLLRTLRSHELNLDGGVAIDFAWRIPYYQMPYVISESCVTSAPFQAFRSGLREGFRLTIDKGKTAYEAHPKLPPAMALELHLPSGVRERLTVWCSTGADVENGDFAILGARVGLLAAFDQSFQPNVLADFDWIASFWEDRYQHLIDDADAIRAEIGKTGEALEELLKRPMCYLTPRASAQAKSQYRPNLRHGSL